MTGVPHPRDIIISQATIDAVGGQAKSTNVTRRESVTFGAGADIRKSPADATRRDVMLLTMKNASVFTSDSTRWDLTLGN